MTDPLTGIHEPMVIIPIGMDCREEIWIKTIATSAQDFTCGEPQHPVHTYEEAVKLARKVNREQLSSND